MEHNRWKCRECDHICTNAEMLTAPNPFNPEWDINACPDCKEVNSLVAACAIDGCQKDGTCGGTHVDGVYRTTCADHADWLRK